MSAKTDHEIAVETAAEEVRRLQNRVDYLSYNVCSPAYLAALKAVATARAELRSLGGDRDGRGTA